MHLSSTINPLSKSDSNVPVGVFRYRSRGKFLRVLEDYEEMLNMIKRAFDIKRNSCISLHTASLDACKGERVEIDEGAYPLLTMLLDDVEVVQEEIDIVWQRQDEAQETTVVLDDRWSSTIDTRVATLSPLEGLRDALEDTGSSKATFSHPAPNSASTEEEYTPIRAYERDREVYDSRIDDAFEADIRAAEEFEEEQVLQAVTSMEEKPNEDRMPPKAKFKPMSRVTSASSTPQVKKEKEVATPVFTSRGKAPENAPKSLRKEASVTQDTDARFEISITGPKPHQTAQFKTRGKHSVSKVLGAACKTFEIDFRLAKLFYVMRFPHGKTGEVELVEIECNPDETMSQAGVTGETQLFIRIEQTKFDDDLLNFD